MGIDHFGTSHDYDYRFRHDANNGNKVQTETPFAPDERTNPLFASITNRLVDTAALVVGSIAVVVAFLAPAIYIGSRLL